MARETLKELLEGLDLETWFERQSRAFKVSRGRSGMQINAQECPACGDMRWRTYLNHETGVGNCFVCNGTFNKGSFIHRALGHDPDDSSPQGKRNWGLTADHVKEALRDQGWRPKRTIEVAVEAAEAVFPASFPLPTPEGSNLIYLEKRGFTAEISKYFHLRYCEKGVWMFKRDDGNTGWQNFDGRVIIPVHDLDGKLVTFQGRDITGLNDERKYLFPKGLPGTGRYLLNGQNAVRAKRVVMGEGAFDVAAIKLVCDADWDLRDIVPVGSFGKNLSYGAQDGNDQLGRFIQLKAQGLEEVIILWDGEAKALLAAIDAAELLRKHGLRIRIGLLPKDKDPNEVLGTVVAQAIKEAVAYSPAQAIRWRLKNPYSV